jgi:RNA polymerase sigma-70 factor (ECF subfamily)
MRRDPLADPRPLIRSVYAYIAYRIGDGPDAEDVTSETFARALRYRDSFDPKRGEPIGWLIGIARRCIADMALTKPVQELDESVDVAAPGDLAEDSVRKLTVRAAVAQLDEAGRELIALRFGADLKARQIAELTGKTTHAVEVALSRTLDRLREALAEADGPAPAIRPELRPVRFLAPRRYSN